jgi:serine/threonine protein kinase
MSIVAKLKHQNIVAYEGNVLSRGVLYLIFELLKMDLKTVIDGIPFGQFMDRQLVRSYCHQASIYKFNFISNNLIIINLGFRSWKAFPIAILIVVHQDLKPQNLLIGDLGIIKIANVGLARVLGTPSGSLTQEVININFSAVAVRIFS